MVLRVWIAKYVRACVISYKKVRVYAVFGGKTVSLHADYYQPLNKRLIMNVLNPRVRGLQYSVTADRER